MRTSIDLHNFLQSLDIPHEINLVEISATTVSMASLYLGLETSEIAKTLIVEADGVPVVVVLPGNRRLDIRKLKKITGVSDVRFADPGDMVAITGYVRGSTPPLAHDKMLPLYVDQRLLTEPVVYTCGGQSNTVLKICPNDLVAAGNARICDIADDGRV
ncbi:MAG TPA: YbaK/EbsC family protein [Candidatus Aquicultor sp.]|jgi:Cys-tRNA(Pro)/Cys-tRNA(Cys) deacylase